MLLKTDKVKKSVKDAKKLKRAAKSYNTDYSAGSGNEYDEPTMYKNEDTTMAIDGISDFKDTKHQTEKEILFEEIKNNHFGQMKYFLDCGFNLLVFGSGSKRSLMNVFVDNMVSDQPCFIVNGYHSGTNLKVILSTMCKFITENIE